MDLGYSYRLQNVGYHVDNTTIINDVTIDIEAGEKVSLVGPSGAGKTTLLRILAAQLQPESGTVKLFGRDTTDISFGQELSTLVGVINQQFDLVGNMTVIHNVLAGKLGKWGLFRSLVSMISPQESESALAALDRVGLTGKENMRVANLSGGEQQRVAVARLIVQDPSIIIADEPVASLDPARSQEIISLIVDVAESGNKTLISSIHSSEIIENFFDRVIAIRQGSILFDIPTTELTDGKLNELYRLQIGSDTSF